jgi:hypothetical protein
LRATANGTEETGLPNERHAEEQNHRRTEASGVVKRQPISAGIRGSARRRFIYGRSASGIQELLELRRLRDENSRLKRLVAGLSLYCQILQVDCPKKR